MHVTNIDRDVVMFLKVAVPQRSRAHFTVTTVHTHIGPYPYLIQNPDNQVGYTPIDKEVL